MARLTVALVGLVACSVRPPAARAQRATRPGSETAGRRCEAAWSPPTDLQTSDGRPVYVEAPFAVKRGSEILLLGLPTLEWQSPTELANLFSGNRLLRSSDSLAGTALDEKMRGRGVPRPPGASAMRMPRAASDGANVHVIWGETADTTARADIFVTELWYARYGKNGQWSTPERVFSAQTIFWNSTVPALRLIDGEPMVAVAAGETGTSNLHKGVAVVRRVSGEWRTSWISTYGPLPSDVIAAPSGGNHLTLAFVGAVIGLHGQPSQDNSVFVARSRDDGVSWTAPVAIERLGTTRGYGLLLLPRPNDTLHLAWAVDASTSNQASRLTRFVSSDGGATWTGRSDTPIASPLDAMTGGLIGGEVRAVGRAPTTGKLLSIVWPPSGPAHIDTLSTEPAISLPRLSAIGKDSLMLTWGVMRSQVTTIGGRSAPALQLMTLSGTCALK
jgi:hypothetical protein